jgi:hypothetical protein
VEEFEGMKATDFRDATFEGIRESLNAWRQVVYVAWQAHGPGTTREIAERSGESLLTLRPRSTELLQMGLLSIVGKTKSDQAAWRSCEGIYRVTTAEEWEEFRLQMAGEPSGQQLLI